MTLFLLLFQHTVMAAHKWLVPMLAV